MSNRRHGLSRTPEYSAWGAMIRRCTNPSVSGWMNYGGRGISVCQRWMDSFEDFLADVGTRPTDKHSIDRIDNDGNYEPGNIRWATRSQQNANQRKRTHCKEGHPFDASSPRVADGKGGVRVRCRICMAEARERNASLRWTCPICGGDFRRDWRRKHLAKVHPYSPEVGDR